MRPLSLEEKKTLGLQLLNELDRVCTEFGIPYYLAYGTLLGAARHKGFIPWDDDIDIWVPAEHYRLLLDTLEKHTKYRVINNLENPDWPRMFSKLTDSRTKVADRTQKMLTLDRSLGLDIFPLGHFKSQQQAYRLTKIVHDRIIACFMYRNKVPSKAAKYIVLKAVARIDYAMGRDELYWQKRYLNMVENDKNCRFIGRLSGKYGRADILPAALFEESTLVEFEGKKYPAPARYAEVLSQIYGSDYMELPPESKRVSVHDVEVYLQEDE